MVDWPHAPIHRLGEAGAYIVTASTYGKQRLFRDKERLSLLHDQLLQAAADFEWRLQAWAVMESHYHFVGISPDDPASLRLLIRQLHGRTSRLLNQLDGVQGRKVWFQFWDTELTYERSYLARLKYVHENPVRHGLVESAEDYPWCSARWFAAKAPLAFYRVVYSFPIDNVHVVDDF